MADLILSVLRQSWQQFEIQVISVAPNVLAALFILLTGTCVAWLTSRVLHYALRGAQLDRYAARFGITSWLEGRRVPGPTALVVRAAKWAVVVVAGGLALYSLMPLVMSELTVRFLSYAPDIVAAVLILAAGVVASRFLSRAVLIAAVNDELRSPHLLGSLTRMAVLAITLAAALEQLGIARMTVLAAFAILLGGATLAAALAVGLGSQEVVRRWLADRSSQPRDEHYRIRHW